MTDFNVRRDMHGNLYAETRIDLPQAGERKFMLIRTSKRHDKTLTTTATVNTAHEDGLGYTHAYGFGSRGDFSRTLIKKAVRCTEKAIRIQHEEALVTVTGWNRDSTIEDAINHYAKQREEVEA